MTIRGKLQVLSRKAFLFAVAGFSLASCVTAPPPSTRMMNAQELAASKGWTQRIIQSGNFELLAFHPESFQSDQRLTVYIKGDGFAWMSSAQPSNDPTPINPIALKMALAHPAEAAVYLGRPCQYVMSQAESCDQRYWTNARFAPEVIAAMNSVISTIKDNLGATELSLVGYSGGAAIAVMIAAQRDDVAELVTVAGNLDHQAWTSYHRLAPLSGSLNAADYAQRVAHIPQRHFIGERDSVIPPSFVMHWPEAFTGPQQDNIHIIADFDHGCCWERNWPVLVSTP